MFTVLKEAFALEVALFNIFQQKSISPLSPRPGQARPSCDSVFGDMMVIIIRAQQFDFLSLIQVNSASIYCKTGHPWEWSRIVDKSRVEIKP